MNADDPAAATLAEWGQRIKRYEGWCLHEDAHEIALQAPRLLAAVEAALKLTEPDGEVHRDLDGNEEKGLVRVVRCDVLRAAITAALTGEADNDG